MRNLNYVAVVAALLSGAAPSLAAAEGSFYLGGSLGSASLNDDFDGFAVDSDSTAFRVIAGWQFNEYFSLEGGYHQFGAFEQTFDVAGETLDVSLKADGFTLGATGTIPLAGKFALYGRAGSFFWDGDADINNVSQADPGDTNLYFGAGARYAFTERFALIGDWTRYELEDTQSDVVSLGFTVGF